MPLYRLEKIRGERYKAPIRRQRMCDWIGYVVDNWLNLICHSIRQGLFKSDYLQIDETPIRYLDNERKGKSHKVTSGPRATSALTGSLLQSDGYIVYDSVTRDTDIIHKQLQEDRQIIRADISLAEAINYTLSQWGKLTTYLEHPQARIDNNLTEQSIRPCKLGAGNWLFIGIPVPTTAVRSSTH